MVKRGQSKQVTAGSSPKPSVRQSIPAASSGLDRHKVWLIGGISVAVILVLALVLYSPLRETFAGKAHGISEICDNAVDDDDDGSIDCSDSDCRYNQACVRPTTTAELQYDGDDIVLITEPSSTLGRYVTDIVNWETDDASLTVLNMPFASYPALDYSGHDNHGTVHGVSFDTTAGHDNSVAAVFDGDGYIAVTSDDLNPELTSTGHSISLWFRNDAAGQDGVLLSRHSFSTAPWSQYGVGFMNNNLDFRVTDGTTLEHLTTPDNFETGRWYHLVAMWDNYNDIQSIYIDGGFLVSRPTSITSLASGNRWPLAIGADPDGGSGGVPRLFYSGSIDDVKFYKRVLTPAEISSLSGGDDVAGSVLDIPFDAPPALDYSGSANEGTLHGVSFDATGGYDGQGAYSFDGVDDYIEVADSGSLDLSMFTVTAWVKLDELNRFHGIMGKSGTIWSDLSFSLRVRNDPGGLNQNRYSFVTSADGSTAHDLFTRSEVSDTDWHFVAFSYDGATKKIFVDGVEEESIPWSGLYQNDQPLRIGAYAGGNGLDPSALLNGSLDELKIYNRALTSEQVQASYEYQSLTRTVLNLPFEGITDVRVDRSGNGNDVAAGASVGGSKPTPEFRRSGGRDGGGAVDFDGGDDYLTASHSDELNPGEGSFSASVWVNVQGAFGGTAAQTGIIKKMGGSDYYLFELNGADWSGVRMLYELRDNSGGDGDRFSGIGTTPLQVGWNHLVYVIDRENSRVHLYLNGVLDVTHDVSALNEPITPEGILEIGRHSGYFNGLMDDIRLFDYTLSEQQVGALFNNHKDRIVAGERGDSNWQALVTPNDGITDGVAVESNIVGPEVCDDGDDNDANGRVDCDDDACSNFPACVAAVSQELNDCNSEWVSDATYRVMGDITTDQTACFIFDGATGVTLDCQGHMVTKIGTRVGQGINIAGSSSGVTISNCGVDGFSTGVIVQNSNQNTVLDVTVQNTNIGVNLLSSTNTELTNINGCIANAVGFVCAGATTTTGTGNRFDMVEACSDNNWPVLETNYNLCTTPELCTGGADEDGDGAVDCDDFDCSGDAACVVECTATNPSGCETQESCISVGNYWHPYLFWPSQCLDGCSGATTPIDNVCASANGVVCSNNNRCHSGYCNLVTSQCQDPPPADCTPNWECTEWGECGTLDEISGSLFERFRSCPDTNNCGTTDGRPPMTELYNSLEECEAAGDGEMCTPTDQLDINGDSIIDANDIIGFSRVARANEDLTCGDATTGPCSLSIRGQTRHYSCDDGTYDFDTAVTCGERRCLLIDINNDGSIDANDIIGFSRVARANEDLTCGDVTTGPCSLSIRGQTRHYACDDGTYNFDTEITCS